MREGETNLRAPSDQDSSEAPESHPARGTVSPMLRSETARLDLEVPLAAFASEGYARLGRVASRKGLLCLRERADAIMLANTSEPTFFYQHDSVSGRYEDLEYGQGWRGPSLGYRKVEKLERDPVFRAWIENPLFERIAKRVLGPMVMLYRAVLWNKAANAGTELPWHQDDGVFWGLDRPPCLQIWTALDDASAAAGCLEVIPRSHREGLATPEGGTIPDALTKARCRPESVVRLEAEAGESILLHNHLWHRSRRNTTNRARRAIGIAYLSGDTRCTRKKRAPRRFEPLFEG